MVSRSVRIEKLNFKEEMRSLYKYIGISCYGKCKRYTHLLLKEGKNHIVAEL